MPKIIIICGPPGSGKSTLAEELRFNFIRISQDDQGKDHLDFFKSILKEGTSMCIDRMNFDKKQRERYLKPAKEAGYETHIIVFHENRETCLKRCIKRFGQHPTIHTEQDANSALDTFFNKYERPTNDEADIVEFRYPQLTSNLSTIIVDLDGTMCNTEHRQHHVRKEGKKDWNSFFKEMNKDPVNEWCKKIVNSLRSNNIITMCSGRPDSYRKVTKDWLEEHRVFHDNLFMRPRNDSRDDTVIKEIILDFEILTRYSKVEFAIDDRKRVVDLWRRRGITCLACAEGDF